MYSGLITMYDRCPRCGHQFEREQGFFQGAMYVSWVTSVGLFVTIALLARLLLASHIGLIGALAVAVLIYMPCVPILFRYSRVIWAHLNIGTRSKP
jgi:uncharacterized protein (DUF983 family)